MANFRILTKLVTQYSHIQIQTSLITVTVTGTLAVKDHADFWIIQRGKFGIGITNAPQLTNAKLYL